MPYGRFWVGKWLSGDRNERYLAWSTWKIAFYVESTSAMTITKRLFQVIYGPGLALVKPCPSSNSSDWRPLPVCGEDLARFESAQIAGNARKGEALLHRDEGLWLSRWDGNRQLRQFYLCLTVGTNEESTLCVSVRANRSVLKASSELCLSLIFLQGTSENEGKKQLLCDGKQPRDTDL